MAGGLMVLPFSGEARSTVQVSAKIKGFALATCGSKKCLKVESKLAFVGLYGGNYAFESAQITISDKKTGQSNILHSKDTYYDIVLDKIFMRNLADHQSFDGIYDLRKEELVIVPSEEI